LRFIFLVQIVVDINHLWVFHALCNKVHNFRICKHHGTRFINCLFVKPTILCKPLLNISHIQKQYQNYIFDIPNDFLFEFV
jgi:hypothetical protein